MKLYYKLCEYKDGSLANYYPTAPDCSFGDYNSFHEANAAAIRGSVTNYNQIVVIGNLEGNREIVGVATNGLYVEVLNAG